MTYKHKSIIVYGIVQGVGFRYSANHFARAIGIKGTIKNMPDGSLNIEAEGNETQLNTFIKWCYKGPSGARVINIDVTDGELKNYNFFDIIY